VSSASDLLIPSDTHSISYHLQNRASGSDDFPQGGQYLGHSEELYRQGPEQDHHAGHAERTAELPPETLRVHGVRTTADRGCSAGISGRPDEIRGG